MYPSIKISTIKKSVILSARKLTAATKKTINLCLELIRFRMRSTLISFDVNYYEYNGSKKEEQGLAIGGYESTLLSNLVVSYPFEIAKAILNPTTYHGIYLNDGTVVFNGKKSVNEIKDWLEEFQKTVNRAADN